MFLAPDSKSLDEAAKILEKNGFRESSMSQKYPEPEDLVYFDSLDPLERKVQENEEVSKINQRR
jgi:hypothetical protein